MVKVNTELTVFTPVNTWFPQGNVLGTLLYLIYTAVLPTSPYSFTGTIANNAAVVTVILPLLPKNCKPPSSLFIPAT
jgi:hypothetical protein